MREQAQNTMGEQYSALHDTQLQAPEAVRDDERNKGTRFFGEPQTIEYKSLRYQRYLTEPAAEIRRITKGPDT